MNNKKVLNWMSMFIYIIYLGSIIYFVIENKLQNILFALASLAGTIILVYLNKKFDKLFDTTLIITLVIFILFAGLLGSSFGLYASIKNYDDFLHMWSGIISCSVAYVLFNYFGNIEINSTKRKIFFVIFMFMFSMGGASLWELIEFSIDKFLGMNCQAGGLVDTMMDTFDCLIGSIIMIPYYLKKSPKS
ncbi:hypothetical protein [Terrisporobacter mayombei]|uniref:DUF2238 domain-containing protein n=1 Tax=Terrisporobacter mayombei TaxID=1541 RepID=A0ABY9PZI1_9FIRM|nr:hypothetical protein [Terrisporobacter mayombei]MCC3866883.1 hypothetical protein [Terrisporobacter mayombei]WMT81127.1 hypothetical protein TEMA_14590 [Terrisporobacter mayombei]